jgi:hypothetical protein
MGSDSRDTFGCLQSQNHGKAGAQSAEGSRKCLNFNRSGQAAVEYVLVVAISVLIFGVMFSFIRQGLFQFWVCEIGVQVQAPRGCGLDSPTSCLRGVSEAVQSSRLQAGDASTNILALCSQ